jgi:hypothetical protein
MELMAPFNTSATNLTLSYDAIDILGENDKSLFLHKRPLLNADTMVKKGHFKSALEIYYRAVNKITNAEVQAKIQKNISDIHTYLKSSDPDSEKAFLEKYSDNREKEFSESLKELTENLSDSLTEKLNILKQIETVPGRPSSDNPAFANKASKTNEVDDSEIKPLDLGSLDAKGKSKPNEEKALEKEEEPEEIEGTLTYEEDKSDSPPIEKKPRKANIKVKKDPDSESSNIETESTAIQAEKADIRNESAEFKSDKSEIYNESAEIKNETSIQNASLDTDSVQIGNQNISGQTSPLTDLSSAISEQIDQKGKLELPANEDNNTLPSAENESSKETKVVEEIRVIKEYKESIDSPPPITELKQKPESASGTEETSSIKKVKSVEESEQLLFPSSSKATEIETGWSELEKEPPKPKADKDYAPLMKKYEVGNIEIPEATEFITGEFVSREANNEEAGYKSPDTKKDTETNQKKLSGEKPSTGGIQPGMLQGIPNTGVTDNSNLSGTSFTGTPSSETGFSGTSPEGTQDSRQQAFNVPPLPPPMPLSINDWLSNLFFSKEWEKFRPLPMKERRSGKDRRTSISNELPKGIKKERRSGIDRRNQAENLIHAREAFLKEWHQDNQSYPHLQQPLKNYSASSDMELPYSESPFYGDKEPLDPNLRSMEFLPRDPSSSDRLPSSDELIKVELPEPEEIVLKPPLNQDEVAKDSVSNDISDALSKYVPANEELGLSESDKGLVKIDLPDPVLLKAESPELPHREVSGEIEVSSKDGTGIVGEAANKESAKSTSGMGPAPYTPEAYSIPEELKIELPDPDDFVRTKSGHLIDPFAPEETPEINMIEGDGLLPSEDEGAQISEIPELPPPPPEPERTIHGILELKPPEIDDAPFLTLTYDFSKIPHPFKLSKNYSIMEYSYYKYKPMLMKAQEFARRKMLKNALNYYRVIKSQNIPPELKNMINRNITDITEFLEKFIMSKGG